MSPNAEVTLDGSGSTGNGELTYYWQPSSRHTEPVINVSLGVGTHTYILTVSNEYGSNSDEVVVVVEAESNEAPTFSLEESVEFNADHSGVPDEDTITITLSPNFLA